MKQPRHASMMVVVPASAEALTAIRSAYATAREVQRGGSESIWPEVSDESILSQIRAGCLFCVLDGGEFVGVFTVAREDRLIWGDRERGAHLYLHRIARSATSAGRGIVGAVVAWAHAECRRLGFDGIRLDTWANNPKLVALYERHGFRLVGTRRMGIEPGLSPHYHGIELALFEAPCAASGDAAASTPDRASDSAVLTPETLPTLQKLLRDAGLDGWLLFDFQRCNPIMSTMIGLEGFISRRIFVWVPVDGVPIALGHAIEPGPWRTWPGAWSHSTYSSWQQLESWVGEIVSGRRIAMEYSSGDAVPYLDRVPAGVLDMVRQAGAAQIVSSGELVLRFVATWTEAGIASHMRAAEAIRTIALDALRHAGERSHTAMPASEHELAAWIRERFAAAGLEPPDHDPIVAAGANAANPHYGPSAERPRLIVEGDVLLIDLVGREPGGIFADQTWVATVGTPSPRAQEIWRAIRDARDAAIRLLQSRLAAGEEVLGGDVDDAAREVISARGFGDHFTHRTGHSIDPGSLHGAGPHLDNIETRDHRRLVDGIGFSIEPGVYIAGEIGMRTEVNAFLRDGAVVITPAEYQRELIVVGRSTTSPSENLSV